MKRIVAYMLSVLMIVITFAGCGEKKENSVDLTETLKFSAATVGVNNNDKEDALYKFMAEKFNIDIEIESISKNAVPEKTRIMITSGTMPDVMYGDWNYNDYKKYCKQGLLKPLPDDYATRYPNIAKELERTMISDEILELGNGKLYAIPRAASFGVVYGQGNDVNVGREGFVYRKDWAEKLGIEVKPVMTYDEFYDMAKKFKEADFGGVGKNNVMGMVASPDYAILAFVGSNNVNYRNFYKKDGKYVCGYRDESTAEGIAEYQRAYKEGILHPNFYAHKAADVPSYFLTGKTGLYFTSWGTSFPAFKRQFEESNPGLSADDCLGLFSLAGKDGVLRTTENANYSGAVYFNPQIDDAKFERILAMIDWIASEEGTRIINYGLEGKDHNVNPDGSVNVLCEKDENGAYPAISDLYNSWNLFQTISSVPYCNLNTNIQDMGDLNSFLKSKLEFQSKDIKPLDLDMTFYSGDKYTKFIAANDFDSIITQIAMSNKDAKQEWEKKLNSMEKTIDDVLKEINAALN